MTDPTPPIDIPDDRPAPMPDIDPAPAYQPEIDPAGTPQEMPQFDDSNAPMAVQPREALDQPSSGPFDAAI